MKTKNRVGISGAIFLATCALHGATLNQQYPSLSLESKKTIGISALAGGISGMGIYVLGYSLFHHFAVPRLSEHSSAYILWAGAGAIAGMILAYNDAPESQFTAAKKGFLELTDSDFFAMAVDSNQETVVANLKDYFFKEKFPLVAAYNALNNFYEQLAKYRASFGAVITSQRIDLYEESYFFVSLINAFQGMIKGMIKALKEDPNFIDECNAYAQLVSANAAQSSAAAAWMDALTSRNTQVIVV